MENEACCVRGNKTLNNGTLLGSAVNVHYYNIYTFYFYCFSCLLHHNSYKCAARICVANVNIFALVIMGLQYNNISVSQSLL